MALFQQFSSDLLPLFSKNLPTSKFNNLRIPSNDDIEKFVQCLESSVRSDDADQKNITFNNFMSLSKQFSKNIIDFLQPATFFLAHSEGPPRSYSESRASYARNRIAMDKYDTGGNGTLDREQFIDYYRNEVMTTVDVLKDLEETFEICYTNTVESFCFFFLDPKHWGKIRITDLLVSGFLETAFGLQNNFEDYENWFSPEKTHEMNSLFQMFDTRQKNYLDKEDFKRVQNGSFTSVFIERLFETHVANCGLKMSYEEFVIFQIAYNHLAHPSALSYFFKILDVNSDGYLDNYELNYFYTELRSAYNGWFMDGAMPEFGDFSDQFYDMVKPAVNQRITLQELLACKQGHDFMLCLISHTEFYRYEMRESETGNQDSEMPSYCGEDNLDENESEEENSEKVQF
ncbi:hypothetical protein Mgra_00001477 [Meloidogyne graminicola]|uniref:EF-hand domain-containing protein n=1 Tax=Meloidogyne graminicola TaxID=189291 RepID=A0A8T0A1H3_9BILA|nr:hypothetical protein Mgra_00001477 [Meloidogyne graminicola]